jgi:hypothetical protein
VINWTYFDRTVHGALLGVLLGVGAPLTEVVLNSLFGLWHYPREDLPGMVSWCDAYIKLRSLEQMDVWKCIVELWIFGETVHPCNACTLLSSASTFEFCIMQFCCLVQGIVRTQQWCGAILNALCTRQSWFLTVGTIRLKDHLCACIAGFHGAMHSTYLT